VTVWVGLIGALIAIAGVLAYAGVWRSWAVRSTWSNNGFMMLYIGLCALFVATGQAAHDEQALGLAALLFVLAAASAVIGIVSWFWLPKFLTPRWFRAVRGGRS
jgi:hypothetical protein